jgi:hypothetical protein
VLRAGAGLFYDTGTQLAADGYYGVGTTGFKSFNGDPFPLTTAQIDSVPQPNANPPYNVAVWGFDPHLKSPYTVQWNAAVEQQLGEQQTLNINYVASASRCLLTQNFYSPDLLGNPNFISGNGLYLTTNRASANYQSLQVRFQRTLSHGFQSLFLLIPGRIHSTMPAPTLQSTNWNAGLPTSTFATTSRRRFPMMFQGITTIRCFRMR